ncbi:LCP family protein [Streptomyces albidochromogenes]|uniref:LCP family protein n=1 Tax=Streptomyces albidochromogenes TaxID=329524 RepID=UPI00110FD42A|nr:LCP family protein [Streptomyces albidochromogenes]
MGQSSVRGDDTRERVPRDRSGGATAAPTGGGTPGGGRRRGHGKPRKRRILRWTALTVSVLILGTGGAGYLYYEHLNDSIKREALNLGGKKMAGHKANAAGQTPLNILLIGSDARDTAANKKLGGGRAHFDGPALADVQMLVHLSADRTNMSVVSMPRDTMVKMPKCTAPDGTEYAASTGRMQTNLSLDRGGPGCTVAAWHELTGITIDHFMMVDFAGVVSMADAIGGVPVCVDANVYSRNSKGEGSGLKLREGTTSIKGKQALQWLRTRYGFEDGTDLGRTRAQHMYMNSMIRELRENAKLTNPNKLRKLAEAATDALTVDDRIDTVTDLLDLADEFKKIPTGRITMTTMPTIPYTYDRNRVEPTPGDAEKLFRLVRDDIPLDGKGVKAKPKPPKSKDPVAPVGEIAVTVQNGTGVGGQPTNGRSTSVTASLVAQGFTLARAGDQLTPQEKTTVTYPSVDLQGDAQAVAKSLGVPMSAVKRSTEVTGVTVVVGADWRTGTAYPKPSEDDDKAPKSARLSNGADSTDCMHVQEGFTWS